MSSSHNSHVNVFMSWNKTLLLSMSDPTSFICVWKRKKCGISLSRNNFHNCILNFVLVTYQCWHNMPELRLFAYTINSMKCSPVLFSHIRERKRILKRMLNITKFLIELWNVITWRLSSAELFFISMCPK